MGKMWSRSLLYAALAAGQVSALDLMNLTTSLASNKDTAFLAAAIVQSKELSAALSNMPNITFFAPSNDALKYVNDTQANLYSRIFGGGSLLKAYLNYHVLPGVLWSSNISTVSSFPHTMLDDPEYSNVTDGQVVECRMEKDHHVRLTTGWKNSATIIEPDIAFSGGAIHIVDSILSLPESLITAATASNLTAFIGALQRTNLLSTLSDAKDLTIFAPTNDAFQSVGSIFSNITTDRLTDIASYHVVHGASYSTTLHNMTADTNLAGRSVSYAVTQDSIFVNQARVVNTDILFSGGVIHIIDSVLNPNNSNVAAQPDGQQPVLAYDGAMASNITKLLDGVNMPSTTVPKLVETDRAVLADEQAPQTTAATGISKGGAGAMATVAPMGLVGAAALFGGVAFL